MWFYLSGPTYSYLLSSYTNMRYFLSVSRYRILLTEVIVSTLHHDSGLASSHCCYHCCCSYWRYCSKCLDKRPTRSLDNSRELYPMGLRCSACHVHHGHLLLPAYNAFTSASRSHRLGISAARAYWTGGLWNYDTWTRCAQNIRTNRIHAGCNRALWRQDLLRKRPIYRNYYVGVRDHLALLCLGINNAI